VAAVRSKLKRFPEIVKADIDRKNQRLTMQAKLSFDQYVALEHALEDAGGAIQMFHPRYLVPAAHYAALGANRGHGPPQLEALTDALEAVPGVRSAIVDPDRWFTNERGIDVGGVVVFADTNSGLEREMIAAARRVGFYFEPREHGHAADDHDEWSEANHAFSGLCLVLLAALGMANLALERPAALIRYGSVFVWGALFVFLFIRADRGAWPLGPVGWFESFRDWDTAQHRLGTGLVFAIGVGDYLRIRKGWKVNPALGSWGTLIVGVAGCTMLFTHLHTTIDPSHYRMVARMNAQHITMATTALLFSVSKFAWETWRAPKRWGAYLPLGCLLALGVILTMYVE
jgi:hypothetical protein